MKQYLDLLKEIKEKGINKEPARENMPGTTSLFGYQMRFNLDEGFPIVTTKKLSFKNIATELIWFLRGETNIKYIVDNDCNIWNEDAYNYYLKVTKKLYFVPFLNLKDFVEQIKFTNCLEKEYYKNSGYYLGDCGYQYGKLWRNWEHLSVATETIDYLGDDSFNAQLCNKPIDQIKELIKSLKQNPESRRHIITAWNPATLNNMALNACHSFVQFNCRKLTFNERVNWAKKNIDKEFFENLYIVELAESKQCPKYYLDCQMYQRSGDAFLGVPYNIASYALFTEILAKICNMIPGQFIHTFGDVHIYENHYEQVDEQLKREEFKLPKLKFSNEFELMISNIQKINDTEDFLDCVVNAFNQYEINDFIIENYQSHANIKAQLSTGLNKQK
jgi:thymidylate synthase